MIKFTNRDLTNKGLVIERDIPKESIGLSDEEVDIRSNLKIKSIVTRVDEVILAPTDLEADFGFLCARCLEDLSAHQHRHYDFIFNVDDSLEYYDLGEEIRQEIIMANPARILCSDDCEGICAGCGVNLNKEQCRCK